MPLLIGLVNAIGHALHGKPMEIAADPWGSLRTGDQPFRGGKPLVPSDGADITAPHRALWVGTGGTVAFVVLDADGTTRNTLATSVGDGSVLPFAVLRLMATGTTATGIVAGW